MALTDAKRQAAIERRKAIRECHMCDEYGWLKGADGFAVEPARKCTHGEPSLYHQWT